MIGLINDKHKNSHLKSDSPDNHTNSGFLYMQKDGDEFKFINCNNIKEENTMKEIILKTTRREAIPYIVNLKCECGGSFHKIEPIQYDYQTGTIKHQCINCGKTINSKTEYPQTTFMSGAPEEDFGQDTVFEGIETVIGL